VFPAQPWAATEYPGAQHAAQQFWPAPVAPQALNLGHPAAAMLPRPPQMGMYQAWPMEQHQPQQHLPYPVTGGEYGFAQMRGGPMPSGGAGTPTGGLLQNAGAGLRQQMFYPQQQQQQHYMMHNERRML